MDPNSKVDWKAMAHDPRRFDLDDDTKLSMLGNINLLHANMNIALGKIIHLLMPNNGVPIVGLSGVSGVGKSEMLENVLPGGLMQKSFCKKDGQLYVSAPGEVDKRIMPKAFCTLMLKAGNEPMIDGKVEFINTGGRLSVKFARRPPSLEALEGAVDHMLFYRNFHVVTIDEVVNLLLHGDEEIMLKSLAHFAKEYCPKLLIVTDLKASLEARKSDQYIRRGRMVMFERYVFEEFDSKSDKIKIKNNFKEILKKYEEIWPWLSKPKLMRMSDNLRRESLGQIGTLKAIITSAAKLQADNDGEWKDDFLVASYMAKAQRADLEREWLEAERQMRAYAWGGR